MAQTDLPPAILQASKDKRLILFLGAGISYAAGMKRWDEIRNDLIDDFRPLPGRSDNLKDQLKGMDDPYKCFESICNHDRNIYEKILEKSLEDKSNTNFQLFRRLVANLLTLKPVATITTNFDGLLEVCGEFPKGEFRYMKDCAAQELSNSLVFFIHGDAKKKYFRSSESGLYNDPHFRAFLLNAFCSYNVLFVGYSFRDELLMSYLRLHPRFLENNRGHVRHYALVDKGLADKRSEELKDFYGVEVIPYRIGTQTDDEFSRLILGLGTSQTGFESSGDIRKLI